MLKQFLARNWLTRGAVEAYRLRRRQRDWARRTIVNCGTTTLILESTRGIGDLMIVRQFCEEFTIYCNKHGDPKLGKVVFNMGDWPLDFKLTRGDINIYWWWSMSFRDTWLDDYLAGVRIRPDLICCLSETCVDRVRKNNIPSLLLPLAVGQWFQPTEQPREGIGFGGSRRQKDPAQEAAVTGPFADDSRFEWRDDLQTPQDLASFYNRKQIVLGMTETYQELVGMVNNRVFEVLATAAPFILYAHRNVNQTLGFEYPYQTRSADETLALATEILGNYDVHRQRFIEYSRIVRERHSYQQRIDTLVRHLKEFN